MVMQMAEVSVVVYWVTVVVIGGSIVRIACWNDCRLSDSVCSSHELRRRRFLVTIILRSLVTSQSSGRMSIGVLIWGPPRRVPL